MAKLVEYRAKRDFEATPEPQGGDAAGDGRLYVVQKHDATRLHYDLRLELDGVLKSWAVTRGPSLVPGEKRLAVHVEDHPLDYGAFEGTIPEGHYGGGTVLLWDRGRWEPEGDPRRGYAKGHLIFRVEGEKLHGSWHLVRMRRKPKERQEQWLLIKSEDEWARPPEAPDILEEAPLSVATGRSLEEIAEGKPARARRTGRTGSAQARTAKRPKSPRPTPARARRRAALPAVVEPCLAVLVDEPPAGERWLHEIKWDGYRLLAFVEDGRVTLKSRNDRDWTPHFPAIAKEIAALPVAAAILDGEAVVEDETGVSSFSALQQALSDETGRVAEEAVFYAFDLLHLDGEDLRGLALDARKAKLAGLLANAPAGGALRLSEHLEADGPAMIRNACRLGLEGVVSKRRDLPYRSGRNGDWVKSKCTERQEFVIAGFTPSTATRNAVGSLILGYHEGGRLVHAGRTGTGYTAEIARDLHKRLKPLKAAAPPFAEPLSGLQKRGAPVWVRPELVAEVEFRGWTADRHVRHAAFKGLREDKDARDVVIERAQGAPAPADPPKRTSRRAGLRTGRAEEATVAGVELTHPDRILWDDPGITKQGLAEFYEAIADWVLPHVVRRPLSLVRCPSGAAQGCFFQKHGWAGLGGVVKREMVRDESGEDEVLWIDDLAGLVALVQAGVLEIHPWGATLADVNRPDRLTLDLDPGEGVAWPAVIEGAREIRDRLSALGLESFVKTTGGKGLHVVVPLTPKAGWDEVKAFAKGIADAMEGDHPDRYLATATKRARQGRIYVDYLRNGRGATAVAAYSTRARPGAPVSVPLAWRELTPALKPNHFTLANLPARLKRLGADPWAELWTIRQVLPAPAKKPVRRRRAPG